MLLRKFQAVARRDHPPAPVAHPTALRCPTAVPSAGREDPGSQHVERSSSWHDGKQPGRAADGRGARSCSLSWQRGGHSSSKRCHSKPWQHGRGRPAKISSSRARIGRASAAASHSPSQRAHSPAEVDPHPRPFARSTLSGGEATHRQHGGQRLDSETV